MVLWLHIPCGRFGEAVKKSITLFSLSSPGPERFSWTKAHFQRKDAGTPRRKKNIKALSMVNANCAEYLEWKLGRSFSVFAPSRLCVRPHLPLVCPCSSLLRGGAGTRREKLRGPD